MKMKPKNTYKDDKNLFSLFWSQDTFWYTLIYIFGWYTGFVSIFISSVLFYFVTHKQICKIFVKLIISAVFAIEHFCEILGYTRLLLFSFAVFDFVNVLSLTICTQKKKSHEHSWNQNQCKKRKSHCHVNNVMMDASFFLK